MVLLKENKLFKNKQIDVVDNLLLRCFVAGDENDKIDISNMKLLWKLYLYTLYRNLCTKPI